MTPKAKSNAQAGFTLLEILLVIVMIAITSAMIVPSISLVSQGSVEDEAQRLRSVIRYAMEESQLSGMPLRWLATKDGWFFESLEQTNGTQTEGKRVVGIKTEGKAEWLAYESPPLETYSLPENVSIESVRQASDFILNMEVKSAENGKEAVVVIGMVLLLPDGTTSQSDIHLISEDAKQVLEVRPGPAGVKFKKPET
ncbi:MAG: type II secretion system protein [Ghiorsea sp.]